MVKLWLRILSGLLLWSLLSACQSSSSVCPTPDAAERFIDPAQIEAVGTDSPAAAPTREWIQIGGSQIQVDKVVSGPLCNDTWSGTVYVSCDARVMEWHETPTFFKDCNLEVKPGTVVYVASHNNAAYYQGCSCHTGELSNP